MRAQGFIDLYFTCEIAWLCIGFCNVVVENCVKYIMTYLVHNSFVSMKNDLYNCLNS